MKNISTKPPFKASKIRNVGKYIHKQANLEEPEYIQIIGNGTFDKINLLRDNLNPQSF